MIEQQWIPAKPGWLRLVAQHCPELMSQVMRSGLQEDEPPALEHEIPLWLAALCQGWQGALVLPRDKTFGECVTLVRGSRERQDALAAMSRLGVVSASDVLDAIEQWEQEKLL